MALLAASICLAEIQQVSKDFNPYEPKVSSVPLCSIPFDLPFCIFLYLTLFGINIEIDTNILINTNYTNTIFISIISIHSYIGIALKFFAFIYPHFYSHYPISTVSPILSIVNISSYGLSW